MTRDGKPKTAETRPTRAQQEEILFRAMSARMRYLLHCQRAAAVISRMAPEMPITPEQLDHIIERMTIARSEPGSLQAKLATILVEEAALMDAPTPVVFASALQRRGSSFSATGE